MPCKLEIRDTIERSVAEATDNGFRGWTKAQAAKIVKFLNDAWGKIAMAVSTSTLGSYRIAISGIDEAVDREYSAQLDAEKSLEPFERDLDFYNGDEALYEQEEESFKMFSPDDLPSIENANVVEGSCE